MLSCSIATLQLSSCSENPHFQSSSFSIIITLQLTVCMQLKCSFSIIIVFNCCHFATDHLHAVQMLIIYHCHFQLLSLHNWPPSGVCTVYNIPSLGVKGTSSVLWSSANFCSIQKYALYRSTSFTTMQGQQSGLDMERWLTPWRTSTYERPFTWEGTYLVSLVLTVLCTLLLLGVNLASLHTLLHQHQDLHVWTLTIKLDACSFVRGLHKGVIESRGGANTQLKQRVYSWNKELMHSSEVLHFLVLLFCKDVRR